MSSPESTRRNTATAPSFISNNVDDTLIRVFHIAVLDEVAVMHHHGGSPDVWPGYESVYTYRSSIPVKYPWTLATICRRWRVICLQAATLWTYIRLPMHYCFGSSPVPSSFNLRRVLLQLERSQKAPLIIHADSGCTCEGTEGTRAKWGAVLQHSDRWQELRLQVLPNCPFQPPSYIQSKISDIDASFPSLKRLEVVFCVYFSPPGTIHSSSAECCTDFVNISSVVLTGLSYLESDSAVLPWNRLTCLNLQSYGYGQRDTNQPGPSLTALLKALSKCDSLIHLTFSTPRHAQPTPYQKVRNIARKFPRYSVTIPRLVSLTLGHTRNYAEKRILPFLRLPSLKYLFYGPIDSVSCDSQRDEGPISCNTLIDFIVHSGCTLTELGLATYRPIEPPSESLARLLTFLPQLRCMHMDFDGNPNILREMLLPADTGSPAPCSSLEHLTLDLREGNGVTINIAKCKRMLSVLKSRLDIAVLKTLHIIVHKEWDTVLSVLEEGLKDDVKNGLKMEIYYPDYCHIMTDLANEGAMARYYSRTLPLFLATLHAARID